MKQTKWVLLRTLAFVWVIMGLGCPSLWANGVEEEYAESKKKMDAGFVQLKEWLVKIRQDGMTIQEKADVFVQLSAMKEAALSSRPARMDNLEFAAMVQTFMAGLFFQIQEDMGEKERQGLLDVLSASDKLLDGGLLESALALDGISVARQGEGLSEAAPLMVLRLGFPEAAGQSFVAPLAAAFLQLSRNSKQVAADELLDKMDVSWFAFDLAWAVRCRLLCVLAQGEAGKTASTMEEAIQQRNQFEEVFHSLSDEEQEVVFLQYPTTDSERRRIGMVRLEVQEHLRNKGHQILRGMAARLGTE